RCFPKKIMTIPRAKYGAVYLASNEDNPLSIISFRRDSFDLHDIRRPEKMVATQHCPVGGAQALLWDGKRVVTGSQDGSVKYWDLKTNSSFELALIYHTWKPIHKLRGSSHTIMTQHPQGSYRHQTFTYVNFSNDVFTSVELSSSWILDFTSVLRLQ